MPLGFADEKYRYYKESPKIIRIMLAPEPIRLGSPKRIIGAASQNNEYPAHATTSCLALLSESLAPGLTRRPAPCGRVVVGPVARRRSGPRLPAASQVHSQLMRVARAPAAAARSILRQVAAGP